jgi:PAS domain S-box-containing protein
MVRFRATPLFVLIGLFLIIGSAPPQEAAAQSAALSAPEREFLAKNAPIVFISQTHYPPFEFVGEDGDHTGMSVELARWIGTEFGFKALFVDASFKEAQEAVLAGRADILTSLFYSVKRDQHFDFSEMVFDVPASLFVKAERPDITGFADLGGKIIAMQAGDYAEEFLQSNEIACTVVYTRNFAEATDRVIAGLADAIIGDEQIVLYHIYANNLIHRIKKVGEPLYVGQNCMAARDGSSMLVGILNKGIQRAKAEGILEKINRKWVGVQYGPAPQRLGDYLPQLLVGVAGVLAAVILVWLWNLNLRRQVAARTLALASSEKTLRTILSASPLGIGLLRGRTIGWHNQALAHMLGYASDELEGRLVDDLFHDPGKLRQTVESLRAAMRREPYANLETVCMRKDGGTFDCQLHYAVMHAETQPPTAIVIAEDITARKGAEAELNSNKARLEELYERTKKSEERARVILDANPDPMVVYDGIGRPAYLNPAFTRVFGWHLAELCDRLIPYVPDDQKTLTAAKIKEVSASDRAVIFQSRRLTKQGDALMVIISAAGIKDPEGRVVETVVSLTDITAIRHTEAERLLLATALHQAAETILITDVEGTLLYANPAFEKTSGYTLAETLGRKLGFLRSGKHDDAFYRTLWTTIRQGDIWSGRLINKKKNGSLFEEEVTISPVRDETGNVVHFVAVKRDVTHEVQLENQLRQAQKMEAIGTLAGGIAHDFNNILSAVMGFTELGLRKAAAHQSSEPEHREVLKAAERARDLVKHILTFSSKTAVALAPLDVNQVVAQALHMVERTIPRMIEIHSNLCEDLKAISGNAGQLNQVLLNLCGNAADAMPHGGRLRIETRNVMLRDGLCSATGKSFGGPFVLLEVADSGHGMDESTKPHIFNPFFTTKPVGKGTGLGLSTVFGIVQSHGGYIVCRSRPGVGTVFGLYFPPATDRIQSEAVAPVRGDAHLRGTETVLLVDDEASLREVGRETLSFFGYRPLLADSGEAALSVYRDQHRTIDVIVLDLSMPGMGGKQCLAGILDINPHARVIIASGYARDGQLDETLKTRVSAYLVKPYPYATLIETIRTVLNKTGRAVDPAPDSTPIRPLPNKRGNPQTDPIPKAPDLC